MTVPLSAVFTPQNKPGQPHVWLVDEQTGTVRSVPVQVGETLDGERIAVTGLVSGQLLVSAGVQRLAEGQAVRLPDTFALAMNGESRRNMEGVSHERLQSERMGTHTPRLHRFSHGAGAAGRDCSPISSWDNGKTRSSRFG